MNARNVRVESRSDPESQFWSARLTDLDSGRDVNIPALTLRSEKPLNEAARGDWIACWAMALAPRLGIATLEFEDAVDPLLALSLQSHANVYQKWGHGDAPQATFGSLRPSLFAASSDRIGIFFSGGIDSTYSATKLSEVFPAERLLLIHATFAAKWRSPSGLSRQHERSRAAAFKLGIELIAVETNVGDVIDNDFGNWWPLREHGAVLGGIAHAASNYASAVFIAATLSADDLRPYGSHPATDPLLSSTRATVANHGADATRLEKVRFLLDRGSGRLTSADVCAFWFARKADRYANCGRCEKCLRTLAEVHACGGEVDESLFAKHLEVAQIDALQSAPDRFSLACWSDIFKELRSSSPYHGAVERLIARSQLATTPGSR
jgi:hypothetical protein